MDAILPDSPYVFVTAAIGIVGLLFALVNLIKRHNTIEKKKKEIERKVFEANLLAEIGERISYQLNIGKILETIVESLDQLIPFSAIGYILVTKSEETELKVYLKESVPRAFIDTIAKYLLTSLNDSSPGSNITKEQLVENLSGAMLDENSKVTPASLWVTPLTIDSTAVGALCVVSTKPGLYKGPEMEVLTKILNQAHRAVARLESIIATEQTKLNAMVISMADGVLMVDQDLNLLVINPATITLLGLPADKKITVVEVIQSLATKMDLRTLIDQSLREDKLVTYENLVVGGKISQVLISPAKDKDQKLLGTVIIFHDITPEKQLEKIREEFTAMMVHELRAPLTVVRGTTDMLTHNPAMAGTDEGQKLLATMEKSSSSMLSLVNDLLDVAKLESGKFQILKTKNNLLDIVSDRVTFFDQIAKPKNISLTSAAIDGTITADFDRERVAQVLNNLLSNAIKFTPSGGHVEVSVKVINSMADVPWRYPDPPKISFKLPCVLVAVSDSGAGIPPDKIPELFSKFKQFHPLNVDDSGTGLGLVIAKGIVESHQGTLFLESRPNEGSVFYFTLPL